ncbi:hypothetical protein SDC9_47352 [bioreactor metagenome]|uniref:Uncharacterized protein n=1 Tax=bioreactor metagenome TaxID=1076179 RepID=A0A644WFN1_9ZZZZ
MVQNEAEAQGRDAPLNGGQGNLLQKDGGQYDGKQLCRNDTLIAHDPPEVALLRFAGKCWVEQEEIRHKHCDCHCPWRFWHTGLEYVDGSGNAGTQHDARLDSHRHRFHQFTAETCGAHDQEQQSNQHLKGYHCVNPVHLSCSVVRYLPLLQEL